MVSLYNIPTIFKDINSTTRGESYVTPFKPKMLIYLQKSLVNREILKCSLLIQLDVNDFPLNLFEVHTLAEFNQFIVSNFLRLIFPAKHLIGFKLAKLIH